MNNDELIVRIMKSNVRDDYLVLIEDLDSNYRRFEYLEYWGDQDIFVWNNDWYEGQPYNIIGYIAMSDLKEKLILNEKHTTTNIIWGRLIP